MNKKAKMNKMIKILAEMNKMNKTRCYSAVRNLEPFVSSLLENPG